MKYKVVHKTTYDYGENVTTCHTLACLKPKNTALQTCSDYDLMVLPIPSDIIFREDFYGNGINYFNIQYPHKKLIVQASSIVDVSAPDSNKISNNNFTYSQSLSLFENDQDLRGELLQFLLPTDYVFWDQDILDFAKSSFSYDKLLIDCVKSLCGKIFKEFKFQANVTNVNTSIKTVLKEKKGVCQDFSHLALACFRAMGLPARYVSGYLETLPPPGKKKLQGSDASHAWISVYVPNYGWYDFDPTNNIEPKERHVTVAWGRDYGDVTPLKGIVFSSSVQALKVEVDVIPLP
jgi:transglutaminase-like putative cysteine protease